jgi:hypothetical protein
VRTLSLLAFLASCAGSSIEPQLGANVELRYGALAQLPGDTAHAQFTEVTSDSRCPSNAQCVWAGEATVLFTVGGSEKVSLRLGEPGAASATAMVRGRQLTLVALKPYPVAGQTISRSDYLATIRFDSAKD